ncbi:MAG: polyprenyl synthetase family protein [Endomicrobiales bacterium]|jgi:octaprenyl-diphosphate synthase
MLKDIELLTEDDLGSVKNLMADCLDSQPQEIRKCLGYHFSAKGKYLRPMLTMMSARAMSNKDISSPEVRGAVGFAAAVEFVHNASLIHDDIMDEEAFRRGKRTLQKKYGRDCAVLLGDVLYTMAFDVLRRMCGSEAVAVMIDATSAMCYGQLLDVKRTKRTVEDYWKITQNKTGKLMSAACLGGAVTAQKDISPETLRNVAGFGLSLGVLYQVADDRLDGDAGVSVPQEEIRRISDTCEECLMGLPPTTYRQKLHAYAASLAHEALR